MKTILNLVYHLTNIIVVVGITLFGVNYLLQPIDTDAAPGDIDTNFDYTSLFNNSVDSIKVQPDGKILVAGRFTQFGGAPVSRGIARLNADGTLDTSFNSGGSGLTFAGYSIALQADGKIIVGGQFDSYNGVSHGNGVVRLNPNGSLDTSFLMTTGNGSSDIVREVAVQSDGKILIGGWFNSVNGTTSRGFIRLNSNGTNDAAFISGGGMTTSATVQDIEIQSDGKIIIASSNATFNGTTLNSISRLNSDGTIDTAFLNNTSSLPGQVNSIEIDSTGKIVVAGDFTAFGNRVARLNPDGTLDNTFSVGVGPNSQVYDVEIQSTGKIIIGGAFTAVNGNPRSAYARLEADGSLDVSFDSANNPLISFTVPPVIDMEIDDQDNLLLGGNLFTSDYTKAFLIRIDGTEALIPSTCGSNNTSQTSGSANTSVCLSITGGVATIYAGDATDNDDICTPADDGNTLETVACDLSERSVDLAAATVLNVRQETTTLVDDIVIDDLRGLQAAQYTVDVSMCNLVGDQATPVTYALGYTGDGAATGLYARSDADTSGTIQALKPATTVTAYDSQTANWSKGSDTQVTDTVTTISVYSTTADVTPGRYDIDDVEIGFELPSYIEIGSYTCDITYTLTV